MKKKCKHFKCKNEAQKRAIKANYARKAAESKTPPTAKSTERKFPDKFPFWARFRLSKNRTTLIINEAPAYDTKRHKEVDGFVHREATHTQGHGEPVIPNPDKTDPTPMYLRSPRVHPKYLFIPHNKDLTMPEDLRRRYEKDNKDNGDKST